MLEKLTCHVSVFIFLNTESYVTAYLSDPEIHFTSPNQNFGLYIDCTRNTIDRILQLVLIKSKPKGTSAGRKK